MYVALSHTHTHTHTRIPSYLAILLSQCGFTCKLIKYHSYFTHTHTHTHTYLINRYSKKDNRHQDRRFITEMTANLRTK